MSITKPASIGILACPGGEVFAAEIIGHLKRMYKKRFKRKAEKLADRYEMSSEEMIREMNLSGDLKTSKMFLHGAVDTYIPPRFRVDADYTRFASGEFKTEIKATIRDKDIYVIQDLENHTPIKIGNEEHVLSVNDHFFCLLVTVDAALQAGAKSVTIVTPSYPYARQHKKKGREGLTAARLGMMFEFVGVDRIITLDIHSTEIQNSFNKLRLENLHASYQILQELSEIINLTDEDLVIVSPDTGAVGRNKFFAGNLHRPLALLYKERDYSVVSKDASSSNISSIRLLGDVKGKNVFMADDMLGTGGTMIKAMELLKEQGAKDIICAVSLPLFTGNAIKHFDEAYEKGLFHRIIGTNAVYHNDELLNKEWYVSANVSQLFAHTIDRLHHNLSLSPLLDNSMFIQNLIEKQQDK